MRDRDRQLPYAQDVGRAFGHADAAARVEHVEQVRALQALIERRQHEAGIDQHFGEIVVTGEQVAMERRNIEESFRYAAERLNFAV